MFLYSSLFHPDVTLCASSPSTTDFLFEFQVIDHAEDLPDVQETWQQRRVFNRHPRKTFYISFFKGKSPLAR
jgi:hypothetical protein